jgi:hypothetical protein
MAGSIQYGKTALPVEQVADPSNKVSATMTTDVDSIICAGSDAVHVVGSLCHRHSTASLRCVTTRTRNNQGSRMHVKIHKDFMPNMGHSEDVKQLRMSEFPNLEFMEIQAPKNICTFKVNLYLIGPSEAHRKYFTNLEVVTQTIALNAVRLHPCKYAYWESMEDADKKSFKLAMNKFNRFETNLGTIEEKKVLSHSASNQMVPTICFHFIQLWQEAFVDMARDIQDADQPSDTEYPDDSPLVVIYRSSQRCNSDTCGQCTLQHLPLGGAHGKYPYTHPRYLHLITGEDTLPQPSKDVLIATARSMLSSMFLCAQAAGIKDKWPNIRSKEVAMAETQSIVETMNIQFKEQFAYLKSNVFRNITVTGPSHFLGFDMGVTFTPSDPSQSFFCNGFEAQKILKKTTSLPKPKRAATAATIPLRGGGPAGERGINSDAGMLSGQVEPHNALPKEASNRIQGTRRRNTPRKRARQGGGGEKHVSIQKKSKSEGCKNPTGDWTYPAGTRFLKVSGPKAALVSGPVLFLEHQPSITTLHRTSPVTVYMKARSQNLMVSTTELYIPPMTTSRI